jgi:hypothetical protein
VDVNATTFEERMASEPMRRAYQLTYTMRLVSDVAAKYNETLDAGETLFATTMIESFYVHVRLLADFLLKKPHPKYPDIKPDDFGVTWTIPTTAEAQRLLGYWETASGYVVHFGQRRVPANLEDLQEFEISGQSMTRMTVDAFIVLGTFIDLVEKSVAGQATQADGVKTVEVMAAEHLRSNFDIASRQVGM